MNMDTVKEQHWRHHPQDNLHIWNTWTHWCVRSDVQMSHRAIMCSQRWITGQQYWGATECVTVGLSQVGKLLRKNESGWRWENLLWFKVVEAGLTVLFGIGDTAAVVSGCFGVCSSLIDLFNECGNCLLCLLGKKHNFKLTKNQFKCLRCHFITQ